MQLGRGECPGAARLVRRTLRTSASRTIFAFGATPILSQRASLYRLLKLTGLLHQRALGRASRKPTVALAESDSLPPMRICTAKPERPPAIAASIIWQRSLVSPRSRRAFIRSKAPAAGLCLCIRIYHIV